MLVKWCSMFSVQVAEVCCSCTSKVSVTEGNCEAVKFEPTPKWVSMHARQFCLHRSQGWQHAAPFGKNLSIAHVSHIMLGTTPDQLHAARVGYQTWTSKWKRKRFGFGYITHRSQRWCSRNWSAFSRKKSWNKITPRRDEAWQEHLLHYTLSL